MTGVQGLAGWFKAAPPADVPADSGVFECAIAIPARDEADLIGRCLLALGEQQQAPAFAVVLFLNNCRDETLPRVAELAPSLPFALYVYEADLDPAVADAAWARRLALNAAAGLVRRDGVVLSTDADSYADQFWLRSALDRIDEGADVVCGFVAPDFSDLPSLDFETLKHGAMEYEYSQSACELVCRIDPDPHNPWPRHLIETGANLAVRAGALRRLGGIPHICPGEDQAFVRLAERAGLRVRHDFAPRVTTSSRLRGRAAGGWSSDLTARVEGANVNCHEKLEPAATIMRRALVRARLRRLFGTEAFLARAQRLLRDRRAIDQVHAAEYFEEAWAILAASSPALAPRRLPRAAFEANRQRLNQYLDDLRARRAAAAEDQRAAAPTP